MEQLRAFWANFNQLLIDLASLVWSGPDMWQKYSMFGPMVIILLGTGIYLTLGLKFMPILRIPAGFALMLKGRKAQGEGEITPFASLMTALSATVGTGNIAGVATAISLGGPGAVFWMWMTAFVGMATKYTESVLAVQYRKVNAKGQRVGGPMYYIENGLGKNWKWLAVLFALGTLFSGIATGNLSQSTAATDGVVRAIDSMGFGQLNPLIVSGSIAGLIFAVIVGGIKSIGRVATALVPFMAISYVLISLLVVLMNAPQVPAAFASIFLQALGFEAAAGGALGSVIAMAIRYGVERGLYSNEAGQGSAPIAHAAAQTDDPVRQGNIAMLGTFIDTILVCTMTALVIITATGQFTLGDGTIFTGTALESGLKGVELTSAAFQASLPFGQWFIAAAAAVFAFTTIIGWSYYTTTAGSYLMGERSILPIRIIWCMVLAFGAFPDIERVFEIGGLANAAMAAPNLVALLLLSGVVFRLTSDYDKRLKAARGS